MKVLITTDWYRPVVNEVVTSVVNLTDGLTALGHVSASQSETQGLTYIEAMESGLPILCKKDPCLDAVVEEGNNGFQYSSPEQFSEIAARLFKSEKLRSKIGGAARKSALSRFSANGFARSVAEVYEKSAAARRSLC